MATLAFSTVGAGIGSYTGIGSGTGWQIGSMLGHALVGGEKVSTAGLLDLKISGSRYGQVVPTVFGTMRLGGNVIWAGPLNRQAAEVQGGKGSVCGGSSQYLYSASFALAICKGEMGELLKIWADGNLIFDAQSSAAKKMKGLNFRFYPGSEDQSPDSIIQAEIGADNTPAYKGICYLVFDELPLSEFGNRLPNIEVMVTEAGREEFPVQTGATSDFHPDQICLQEDGAFLYSYEVDGGTNILRKIDTDNLSIASEFAIGSDFPELPSSLPGLSVDRSGDLWGGTGYAKLAGRSIFKFNTKLMAVEHQMALPAEIGAVTFSVDIHPFEVGPSFQVAGSQQSGQVTVFDEGLSVLGSIETDALTCEGAFRDENENAWLIMTGNMALSPLSLVNIVRVSMDQFVGSEGSIYQPTIEKYEIPQRELTYAMGISTNITRFVTYLPRTREIVLLNNHRILKWSLVRNVISGFRDGDFSNYQNLNQKVTTDKLVFKRSSSELIYLDPESLEEEKVIDLNDFVTGIPVHAAAYEEETDSLITLASDAPLRRLLLRRIKGEGATYQDIFRKMLLSAELSVDDFDVSKVTGDVDGYLISRQGSLQAVMEPLLNLGDVDLVESNFKLILQTRGNEPPTVIPNDEMMTPLQTTRLQEAELARTVSLSYFDTETGYLPGLQQAKRVEAPSAVGFGKNDVTYNVPVALTAEKAKRSVLQNLKAVWAERDVGQFQLPSKYLHLDPADPLEINGTQHYITQNHNLQDFTQEIETVGSHGIINDLGEITADSGKGYVELPIATPKKTDLFLLDLPLLDDRHANGGIAAQHYYGISNTAESWQSSAVYASDNNTRFDLVEIMSSDVTWGYAVNALPPVETMWRTDRDNYLDVELLHGQDRIEAIPSAELLSGGNLVLVGGELLQFSEVEWLSPTRARLSNLIRGRRGTEDAISNHKVAEKVILLSGGAISKRSIPLAALNITKYFRAVSNGELLEDASTVTQKFTGRDLKPYAPIISSVSRSTDTVSLSWHRRSRIGGQGLSNSPPLAERDERYELEFIYGGQSASIFVSNASSFDYSLDQFNAHFSETQDHLPSLGLRLYQLSEAVGRGIAAIKETI
ncbi:hypothetical protein GUA87_09445 [Sneathiella sp. P13V-1]|uniref:phage tail protein n=1 Tax=Sneathiella sp. P13V-1 TaxID=2697366 RepID=UPI00187BBE67|nr:phage tail protein [Sneathiella sp. P13V-1]MBE7637067.1 hypothetical protein [Sneathiella sp. P13V-1]